MTAIIGRNGVGKTSTIKAILGLIDRSGEITFDGDRVDALATHRIVQRGVGYVPEDREIFSMLTVEENLRLAERDDSPRRDLVAELFPDLVQRRAQRAGTLSGGQQQMVSLARALINSNRLLMVDEPTKGLAPRIVAEVTAALEVAAQTVPILLVEQNVPVIRRAIVNGMIYTLLDQRLTALAGSNAVDSLPAFLRIPLSEPLFLLGTLFILVVMFFPGGIAGIGKRLGGRKRPAVAGVKEAPDESQ